MALTKAERDALPADDFAVPGKRALPIHDERHVRLAHDMLERTKGLSDAEVAEARKRIGARAHELGLDTSDWSKLKAALEFEAMSLSVPAVEDHPNRMPFSGVLTRIDQASDAAPHGSGGRRVILSHEAAEAALPTLLGMGVDYRPDLAGHNAQNKIGIITDATIDGDAIHIKGLIYAADFPDAAARIRAAKDILGFSYEMKNVVVADPGADTLEIESCCFTGAAILKKADAAYHTTSLAASTDRADGDLEMTKEELQAILGPALATALEPINAKITEIEAGQAKITTDLNASKEVQAKVKPHADALRACAASMSAAGIGGHPTGGHVVRLNKMADQMEAAAALGQTPHIYRDHDFLVDAAKDDGKVEGLDAAAIKAAVEAAVAPLGTIVKDLQTKSFNAAAEPERKTLSPDIVRLLHKNGLDASKDGLKVGMEQFDAFLDKSGVDRQQAIALKLSARESGILDAA